MSNKDNTPPRDLHTPPNNLNQPTQPLEEQSSETDNQDPWSEELFLLNIQPLDSDTEDNNNRVAEEEEEADAVEADDHTAEEEEEAAEEEEADAVEADDHTDDTETSTDSEEEEEEEEIAMAQPAPAVSGGQLSSVTPFSGNQGLEGLVYAESIDRAKDQFAWTQVQTSRAAVTRGGNAVANWIRGERAAGINYTGWDADIPNPNPNNLINLRPAFLLRFGPKYTTGGAVAAISDLKQRSGETVGSFLDRVKIAVDMLHYNVPEADRNQAFRDSYTRLVIAQFGSGINDEIREQVFGVAVPPNTIQGVLTAATAIENEKHSKATKLVINNVEDSATGKPEPSELEKKCDQLEKQMKEILAIGPGTRGRGRGRQSLSSIRCYGCGNLGHVRAQCNSSNNRPRGRGNGWGGRGRGNPFQTRRGRFRSNFGASRGRPQFPIGDLSGQWDYDPTEDWEYSECDEQWNSPSNYDQMGSGNDPWGRH